MRRLGQHLAIIGFRAQFTDRDSYGLFSRFHSISPPHIFPLICTLHYSLHSYLCRTRRDVDLKVKLILNNFALVTLPLPWPGGGAYTRGDEGRVTRRDYPKKPRSANFRVHKIIG